MRTKNLWLLLALLVSSVALVAAGCGGDDEKHVGRDHRRRAAPRPPSR